MNANNTENPQPVQPESPETICRRRFLERLSIGLGALCGAALAIPAIGFVLAPLFQKRPNYGAGRQARRFQSRRNSQRKFP
jgi:hypothetical protein